MPKKAVYSNTQAERVLHILRTAATKEPPKPDRLARIELLSMARAEVEELRRKGYSWESIAQLISEGLGEALGAPVLQQFYATAKRKKCATRRGGHTVGKNLRVKPNTQASPETSVRNNVDRVHKVMSLRERS